MNNFYNSVFQAMYINTEGSYIVSFIKVSIAHNRIKARRVHKRKNNKVNWSVCHMVKQTFKHVQQPQREGCHR